MSVPVRPLLMPGVALAAATALTLGPAVVAPPAVTSVASTVQAPTVRIDNIQLAGIGQTIYYAITPWRLFPTPPP